MRVHEVWALTVATAAALSGCASRMQKEQLEHVAKDWCQVIRASQIIPVYPLTEDLQPGDLFLVQMPIDRQQDAYEAKGFLPLDNHIDRLDPNGYQAFYDGSFKIGGPDKPLPSTLLKPGEETAWEDAPEASFPTYRFSVRSGGGFSLALPVQGVPIGLSLLGADAAEGSVTIAEAKTYGVDTITLWNQSQQWAFQHAEFLSHYSAGEGKRNYLRVVSRVYLTGRLNVSITAAKSRSAEVAAGERTPVDLVIPTTEGAEVSKATANAYAENIKTLNSAIDSALKAAAGGGGGAMPSGSVKVVAASSRSISLREDFKRPLVIGYLGFDMEIGRDGVLGPPIPTHALLAREEAPIEAATAGVKTLTVSSQRTNYEVIKQRADGGDVVAQTMKRDLDNIAGQLPETRPCSVHGFETPDGKLKVMQKAGALLRSPAPVFTQITTYHGEVLTSIQMLERTAGNPTIGVDGFDARNEAANAFLASEIQCNRKALGDLESLLRSHQLLLDRANDYASHLP